MFRVVTRKPKLQCLLTKGNLLLGFRMSCQLFSISKESKLLGVTLDNKLTLDTKRVHCSMQCRQLVGKLWGGKSPMKWIHTAMVLLTRASPG